MKKFVTGYKGMVGSELVKRGFKPLDCDISSEISVKYYLNNLNVTKDDLIINCAALTDVDECEKNPQNAIAVNARGVHNIVSNFSGKLIQLSTDHVFSGEKFLGGGYSESHKPDPVNVYGRTKLAGEVMALNGWSDAKVIRSSKLFNQSWINKSLDAVWGGEPKEFTSLINRSFLHVEHFVDGLEWVVDNWKDSPKLLNISGKSIMSYFAFFYQVCLHNDLLDAGLVVSRNYKLKDAMPRPFRGGLNVSQAKRLGVPLYSAFDGIREL